MLNARLASMVGTMTLAATALTGGAMAQVGTQARDVLSRTRPIDAQLLGHWDKPMLQDYTEERIAGFRAEVEDLVIEYDVSPDTPEPHIDVVTLANGDQEVRADGDLVARLVAPACPISASDVLVVGVLVN